MQRIKVCRWVGYPAEGMARKGIASKLTASQRIAKQHGLVIQRVISPGRFDPNATQGTAMQCSAWQSKANRITHSLSGFSDVF